MLHAVDRDAARRGNNDGPEFGFMNGSELSLHHLPRYVLRTGGELDLLDRDLRV